MAKPNDDQLTHWYYRVEGHEFGPVFTSRLHQLTRKGELAAEDHVRRGKAGEWITAGSIEELQAKPRSSLAAACQSSTVTPSDMANTEAGLTDRGASVWTSFRFWLYDVMASIGDRSWLLRRVGLAALLVAALSSVAPYAWRAAFTSRTAPRDAYVTYRALWDELKEKRARQATEVEWNDLAERARGELAPIVGRLETLAGARNRRAQMLLWAGRDCLPQMLVDARTDASASEQRFAELLTNVEKLQQGEAIQGFRPGSNTTPIQSAWRWVAGNPFDTALWGLMITLDLAIVVWLATKWRRRE